MAIRIVMCGAAIVAFCLGTAWFAYAQVKQELVKVQLPETPRQQDFEGKFLSVTTKSGPEYSTSLEKVRVQRLGDQHFLVGVGADDGHPDNWQKGFVIWISLNDVSEITVFGSIDDLKKSMELAGALEAG